MNAIELKIFREKNNLTQLELANYVGTGIRAVQSWEQGIRNISQSAINLIEKFETKEISLKSNYEQPHENTIVSDVHLEYSHDYIPLLPMDAIAGYDGIDRPGVTVDEWNKYRVPEFISQGVEFAVRVSGSSMYPKYSNGDILACRKVHDILFFQWGKVYVIDCSQGLMVKRIFENLNNEECVVCHSDNIDHYPAFSIPKSDIRSLSIVLGVIRME